EERGEPEDDRTFDLRAHDVGVDRNAAIDDRVDLADANAVIDDLDLRDLRDLGLEALVAREASTHTRRERTAPFRERRHRIEHAVGAVIFWKELLAKLERVLFRGVRELVDHALHH